MLIWPVCTCSALKCTSCKYQSTRKASQTARNFGLNIRYICIIKTFRHKKKSMSAIFQDGKDLEYQYLSTIAVVVPSFLCSQLISKIAPPKWIFFNFQNFRIYSSVERNQMFSGQVDYRVLAHGLNSTVINYPRLTQRRPTFTNTSHTRHASLHGTGTWSSRPKTSL